MDEDQDDDWDDRWDEDLYGLYEEDPFWYLDYEGKKYEEY